MAAPAFFEHWIGQLAAAIGGGDDIVIVEPDGLADILRHCLSAAQSRQRYQLLQYAMKALGALPRAQVYLDAGNPGLFKHPSVLTGQLKKAGIQYGRGFSANVANFQWTGIVITWSQQLEGDLAQHGQGRHRHQPQRPRALHRPLLSTMVQPTRPGTKGRRPKLDPGQAGIDGYLWIKDPAPADGPCHGGPPAGQDWPKYAAALAGASQQ